MPRNIQGGVTPGLFLLTRGDRLIDVRLDSSKCFVSIRLVPCGIYGAGHPVALDLVIAEGYNVKLRPSPFTIPSTGDNLMIARLRVSLFTVAALLSMHLAAVVAGASSPESQAQSLLKTSGLHGGMIVHLGCGSGELTAALGASGRYLVQGLDTDPSRVEKTRAALQAKGRYGRVSIDCLAGPRLPYANDLVNLIIVQEPGAVPKSELMRVLTPLGTALVEQEDGWQTIRKPWPEEIDEWTHYLHGADNNAVANDSRVGPPRHLQWKADPAYCRTHNGAPSSIESVVSAQGRLFSIVDEGVIGQPTLPEQWKIVARDAFNGTLLWRKPLASKLSRKCLIAAKDRLYASFSAGTPITILDAETGETIQECAGTEGARELILADGVVVAGTNARRKAAIVAVDASTGEVRWKTPAASFVSGTLVLSEGKVCYHDGEQIQCLDLDDGSLLWQVKSRAGKNAMLMAYEGTVINTAGGLTAFALSSGRRLWTGPGYYERLGLFGVGGLVWPGGNSHGRSFVWTPEAIKRDGLDPNSGEVVASVGAERLMTPGHHYRCYPAKATERYFLLPKRGVEFLDMQGDDHMRHNWLRAPCRHGTTPANGLLYVPPHQCFCYPGVLLTGFNALAAPSDVAPIESKPLPRLTQGPAYREADADSSTSASDWPTYRHDAQRSGAVDANVPARLTTVWDVALPGRITPPVVAEGRLFVAGEETHAVYCIDAATGRQLWLHTVAGRVDSPPTIHKGWVLFGSTDGSVSCLRASDGVLAWRFRAAPEERRIVAREQIESAWPVHGSVLVQDDIVYCTAGRSSYLDGGLYLFGLDYRTGQVVHEKHFWSGRPDITTDAGRPFDAAGTRSDILVSDGEDLYLFHNRFNPDLTRQETPRITKLGDREVSLHLMSNDGFLDKVWFDRSYWSYSQRWPGYYFSYNGPKSGQVLVFDDEMVYGVHVFTGRRGHSPAYDPGAAGYELFADYAWAEPVLRPTEIGREKGAGFSRTVLPKWSEKLPVRIQAMVLAGDRLVVAGPPDLAPPDDPLIAFEGRAGAELRVFSTEEGAELSSLKLDHVPGFDGLIAAGSHVYMTTDDGHILCLGAEASKEVTQ